MENTNTSKILSSRLSCTLERAMRTLIEIFEAHSNTWSARNFDEILLQIISQVFSFLSLEYSLLRAELNRLPINEVSWKPIVMEVKVSRDETKVALLNPQSLNPLLCYTPPYANVMDLERTTLEQHIEILDVYLDPKRMQSSLANHCRRKLSPLITGKTLCDVALSLMPIDVWEILRPLDADDCDDMLLFNDSQFCMGSALVEMSQSPFDE